MGRVKPHLFMLVGRSHIDRDGRRAGCVGLRLRLRLRLRFQVQ